MAHHDNASFQEVQRMRQPWLWLLLLSSTIFVIFLFGYGMIKQLVLGQPWGNRPLPDAGLVIVGSIIILLTVGLTYFFYTLKLITEVRKDGLYVNFFPVSRQVIRFDDIRNCEVLTYNAVKESGGWGIRHLRGGKAYNMSGNRGVQLDTSTRGKVIIGSQRPDELARAIETRM
jgi:hypothetical protein